MLRAKKQRALITGVNGQDGSYLAEYLLSLGYEVHGLIRRSSTFNRGRIDHLSAPFQGSARGLGLHYGDVTDSASLRQVLRAVRPDELYHLAAQSHVGISFEVPEYTADSVAVGTLRVLDAVRAEGLADSTRIYNAATSELFGGLSREAYSEVSDFHPRSPYGVAKQYAFWIAKNYREAFGMHVGSGVLFNHESPRRGENFVTRKISLSIAQVMSGARSRIRLGNLDAGRDWGYAPDFVIAMHLMVQRDVPKDYVVATGEAHTVREFVERAFEVVGVDLTWEGSGLDEVGRDAGSGQVLVEVSPDYLRPAEVDWLVGDSSMIRSELGWSHRVRFQELVDLMVRSDTSGQEVRPYEFIRPT